MLVQLKLCGCVLVVICLTIVVYLSPISSHFVTRDSLEQIEDSVVISLTTLPSRIEYIQPTLDSLLIHQSVLPQEVVLSIPNVSKREQRGYTKPHFLKSYGNRLTILESEIDWGPATKFIPAIQREKQRNRNETLLLIVDDDQIYPSDLVEQYLIHQPEFPGSVLTNRGWVMPSNLHYRAMHVWHSNQVPNHVRVSIVTGVGSYLIQPKFFNQSLWDYSAAPEGAFYMDDVWISGHLARQNVEKWLMGGLSSQCIPSKMPKSDFDSLAKTHLGRYKANDQTIQYFRDDWKLTK